MIFLHVLATSFLWYILFNVGYKYKAKYIYIYFNYNNNNNNNR